jgi:glycosyltransferase involved in cell wall biosynthesis
MSSSYNQGKTEAVVSGLKKAKGTHILLLDSDLQDLQYKGIENAISAIKKDKTIDMIILRRTKTPVGIKVRFYDVLLCGQRVVKKDDLLKTLSLYRPKSYQLEFALNQYMFDKHKNVYWMPLSFKNTWSTKKMGVIQGIYKILDMHIDIIAYIGLYNMIRQVLFFGKREYRD